jgi:hypothetical protein
VNTVSLKIFILFIFLFSLSYQSFSQDKRPEHKQILICLINKIGSSGNISKIVLYDDCTINIQRGDSDFEMMDDPETIHLENIDINDMIDVNREDCKFLKNLVQLATNEKIVDESGKVYKDGYFITMKVSGDTHGFYRGFNDSFAIKRLFNKVKQLANIKV